MEDTSLEIKDEVSRIIFNHANCSRSFGNRYVERWPIRAAMEIGHVHGAKKMRPLNEMGLLSLMGLSYAYPGFVTDNAYATYSDAYAHASEDRYTEIDKSLSSDIEEGVKSFFGAISRIMNGL